MAGGKIGAWYHAGDQESYLQAEVPGRRVAASRTVESPGFFWGILASLVARKQQQGGVLTVTNIDSTY